MMSASEKEVKSGDVWLQVEQFADELHELARTATDAASFYRQLLDGCAAMLAAEGGAVWERDPSGTWQQLYQIGLRAHLDQTDEDLVGTHREMLSQVATHSDVLNLPARSGAGESLANPLQTQVLACRVPAEDNVPRVIELFMPVGMSPETQLGWQELLDSLRQIAADYHIWDEYRRLRGAQHFHSSALKLLQRVNSQSTLNETAFEIANEGRQLVGADRLSVAVRQGRRWKLLAVSGVERIDSRSDSAKSLRALADWGARWGEPLDFCDHEPNETYPEQLQETLTHHADATLARRIVVVPHMAPNQETENKRNQTQAATVLIAEQFQAEARSLAREQVLEVADLCLPALERSLRLNRFPVRSLLRWSEWWSQLGLLRGVGKFAAWAGALALIAYALIFLKTDFEIEAPARLMPLVEHDVFAPSDGTVDSVLVEHGQLIEKGALLATVDDPQLVLELQRVRGEIETTRKRLEAIAVARTDRNVREDIDSESLSLSAEAQQFQQQLESLRKQVAILEQQRGALQVVSPIAGMVLTLDVQHELDARPVARGQVLFTIADPNSGWKLLADIPQDHFGYVLQAGQDQPEPTPVRFRLAGDREQTYSGHVKVIREVAVLETNSLPDALPTVTAEIELKDQALANARPGMNAQVRIQCGRRSLGYVWLHDVWNSLYSWVVF